MFCWRVIKWFVSIIIMKQEPSKQVSVLVLCLSTTVVWELHYFRSKVNIPRFWFSLIIENYCFLITYQDGKNSWVGVEGRKVKEMEGRRVYDQRCYVNRERMRAGSRSVGRGKILSLASRCLICSWLWDPSTTKKALSEQWAPALHRGIDLRFWVVGSST